MKNNLNQCIDAINLLVSDTKYLISSATLGKLNDRADELKHQGDFRRMSSRCKSNFGQACWSY